LWYILFFILNYSLDIPYWLRLRRIVFCCTADMYFDYVSPLIVHFFIFHFLRNCHITLFLNLHLFLCWIIDLLAEIIIKLGCSISFQLPGVIDVEYKFDISLSLLLRVVYRTHWYISIYHIVFCFFRFLICGIILIL
jgi:hypothetical protein